MALKRLNRHPCLYAFFTCAIDSKMNPENCSESERRHRTMQSCSLKMKFQSKLQICTSENKRLRRAPFPRVPPISSRKERRCLSQPLEWSLFWVEKGLGTDWMGARSSHIRKRDLAARNLCGISTRNTAPQISCLCKLQGHFFLQVEVLH